jgi:hypothetical protein
VEAARGVAGKKFGAILANTQRRMVIYCYVKGSEAAPARESPFVFFWGRNAAKAIGRNLNHRVRAAGIAASLRRPPHP